MSKYFPIIFLWTHPRSVSSALERVMLQRGDMQTLHEPFIYLYYLGDANKTLLHFDPHFHGQAQHPQSYQAIKSMILDTAVQAPIFVKDMCYYVSKYIDTDKAFLREVKNTFLIRTPARSIPSYYKLDPEVSCDEIGLDAVYKHAMLVADITGEMPIIIDAEDLIRDPKGTLRAYCQALGIRFIEASLNWGDDALPKEWMHVAGWHTDLSGSSGIGRVQRAATSLDDAPHLRQLCDYHMPYYEKLRAHCLRPVKY